MTAVTYIGEQLKIRGKVISLQLVALLLPIPSNPAQQSYYAMRLDPLDLC